jgi:hypothetical protein
LVLRLSEWLGRISGAEAGGPTVKRCALCLLCAEPVWVWGDTQANKVEAICIPAGCHSRVFVKFTVAVTDACFNKQGKGLPGATFQ